MRIWHLAAPAYHIASEKSSIFTWWALDLSAILVIKHWNLYFLENSLNKDRTESIILDTTTMVIAAYASTELGKYIKATLIVFSM